MPKPPRKKRGSRHSPSHRKSRSPNLGVLIEALRSDVQQVAEGHQQLADKIDGVRTELKGELHEKFTILSTAITETRQDVSGLRDELHQTRDELRTEIQAVRDELHQTRDELRTEIQAVRDELHTEIQATREEIRTHTHAP